MEDFENAISWRIENKNLHFAVITNKKKSKFIEKLSWQTYFHQLERFRKEMQKKLNSEKQEKS